MPRLNNVIGLSSVLWNYIWSYALTWIQAISFQELKMLRIHQWKQSSDTSWILIFALPWLFSAAWAQFKLPAWHPRMSGPQGRSRSQALLGPPEHQLEARSDLRAESASEGGHRPGLSCLSPISMQGVLAWNSYQNSCMNSYMILPWQVHNSNKNSYINSFE